MKINKKEAGFGPFKKLLCGVDYAQLAIPPKVDGLTIDGCCKNVTNQKPNRFFVLQIYREKMNSILRSKIDVLIRWEKNPNAHDNFDVCKNFKFGKWLWLSW